MIWILRFLPGSVIAEFDIIMNTKYKVGDTEPLAIVDVISKGIKDGKLLAINVNTTQTLTVQCK